MWIARRDRILANAEPLSDRWANIFLLSHHSAFDRRTIRVESRTVATGRIASPSPLRCPFYRRAEAMGLPEAHEPRRQCTPAPVRVLVVDDNPAFLDMAHDALEWMGCAVQTARSGREALSLFDSDPPSAVLLDLRMPEMDGAIALAEFQRMAPHVPIIIVSATWDEDIEQDLRRQGAFDYIRKPMDLDVLWAVVGSATRWLSFPDAEESERAATRLPSPVLAEIAYRVFGIVRGVVGPAGQREHLETLAREALRRVRLGHSHRAREVLLELRQHVARRASAWLSPTDANALEVALAPVHRDPSQCEASHLDSSEGTRLDGIRILVVDDEPDSLELMRIVFELCGAKVATASSADRALALFAETGADVLVSDLAMPGHDGYWLVHQVLNTAQRTAHRVAALAVTGQSQREHSRLALGAGFRDYLVKPIEPDELCRRVRALAA